MSNDTHPLSSPGTTELADKADAGTMMDTGPLDAADLPEEALQDPEDGEPSPLIQDAHSQPVGAMDVHSVPAMPAVQAHVAEPPQAPLAEEPLEAQQPATHTPTP